MEMKGHTFLFVFASLWSRLSSASPSDFLPQTAIAILEYVKMRTTRGKKYWRIINVSPYGSLNSSTPIVFHPD